jgi:hypothetical protein
MPSSLTSIAMTQHNHFRVVLQLPAVPLLAGLQNRREAIDRVPCILRARTVPVQALNESVALFEHKALLTKRVRSPIQCDQMA